jgi:hypothetical protein
MWLERHSHFCGGREYEQIVCVGTLMCVLGDGDCPVPRTPCLANLSSFFSVVKEFPPREENGSQIFRSTVIVSV